MNKEVLIEKLQQALEYEEDLIFEDTEFYKYMMKESGLSDEKVKRIEKLFNEVAEDTKRHREIITKLKQEVATSQKYEF